MSNYTLESSCPTMEVINKHLIDNLVQNLLISVFNGPESRILKFCIPLFEDYMQNKSLHVRSGFDISFFHCQLLSHIIQIVWNCPAGEFTLTR
jgi:hypothetical protein